MVSKKKMVSGEGTKPLKSSCGLRKINEPNHFSVLKNVVDKSSYPFFNNKNNKLTLMKAASDWFDNFIQKCLKYCKVAPKLLKIAK